MVRQQRWSVVHVWYLRHRLGDNMVDVGDWGVGHFMATGILGGNRHS